MTFSTNMSSFFFFLIALYILPLFYETIFDDAFDLAFSDFLHFFFSAGFEMAAGEG